MTVRRVAAGITGLLLTSLTLAVAVRGGAPFALDAGSHRWALHHRSPALSAVSKVASASGSGISAYCLAAIGGAAAVARRRRWWLGGPLGVAALLAGQMLRSSLAIVIARPRPPVADWMSDPSGYAFPSGHTTTAALLAAGIGATLYRRARRPASRAAAIAVPCLWALAVGTSRIYLGVHWPTDVAAGWLLAATLACAFLPPLGALLAWVGDQDESEQQPQRP